jgi:hypothetical protein
MCCVADGELRRHWAHSLPVRMSSLTFVALQAGQASAQPGGGLISEGHALQARVAGSVRAMEREAGQGIGCLMLTQWVKPACHRRDTAASYSDVSRLLGNARTRDGGLLTSAPLHPPCPRPMPVSLVASVRLAFC